VRVLDDEYKFRTRRTAPAISPVYTSLIRFPPPADRPCPPRAWKGWATWARRGWLADSASLAAKRQGFACGACFGHDSFFSLANGENGSTEPAGQLDGVAGGGRRSTAASRCGNRRVSGTPMKGRRSWCRRPPGWLASRTRALPDRQLRAPAPSDAPSSLGGKSALNGVLGGRRHPVKSG